MPDWIGAHIRAFEFFGGAAALVVSDNLKSAVVRACFHEPDVNRSYTDLARHYQTAILPARPYKPTDKAKVEAGVLLVQRWIVARLRNRVFFSLEELNAAIREELARLNARVSRHLGASRQQLFEQLDKPALIPLPPTRHAHCDWEKVTVGADYHIRIKDHYYSVPYGLVREALWVRITVSTIEAFKSDKRVASHRRAGPEDGCDLSGEGAYACQASPLCRHDRLDGASFSSPGIRPMRTRSVPTWPRWSRSFCATGQGQSRASAPASASSS